MTDSTENAAPLKFTKSRISNFTIQIQLKPKSQFEFVPRDAEESEFFCFGGFRGCSIYSGICHVRTYGLQKIKLIHVLHSIMNNINARRLGLGK